MATANLHLAYRADIDGLRAVAVLSVVIFHAFPQWGAGGFVGVDIFFVISGFLISSTLYDSARSGSFRYADFYDRRVRRIFPALILVLTTCLLFATSVAFPLDTRSIGKHLVGGAVFVSNLLLWTEAGYFDGSSELKPLLHLWSLSVEEQYYIFWPIVVLALFKRKRWCFGVMLLLVVVSFALNVATVHERPETAFYSPVSRMWELLAGSLLAYVRYLPRAWSAWLDRRGLSGSCVQRHRSNHVVAGLGALALAFAILGTSPHAEFPGWWAVLPVAGSTLLIAAGSQAWFNQKVLSARAMVFVGKISYPLYLWHWPLLTFPKVVFGEASRNMRISAVLVSLCLAWVTYRYAERPIRFGPRKANATLLLGGAVAALGLCGGLLVWSDGWIRRYPAELHEIALAPAKFDYRSYRIGKCFLNPEQTFGEFDAQCSGANAAQARKVWLWGDSHAAALYPGLRSLVAMDEDIALSQFTASACPPLVDFTVKTRSNCKRINDEVLNSISRSPPDMVLMAANWTYYSLTRENLEISLERTTALLRSAGVKHVVLIGPVPRWKVDQPTNLMRQWRDTKTLAPRSYRAFNAYSFEVDEAIRAVAARSAVDFVSPISMVCDKSGCLQTVELDGLKYPMAWDDAHLTTQASVVYARQWLASLLARLDAPPKP